MYFKRLSIVFLLLAAFHVKRYSATTDDFLDDDDEDPKSKRQIAGSLKSIQHPPNSSTYFVPGLHIRYGIDDFGRSLAKNNEVNSSAPVVSPTTEIIPLPLPPIKPLGPIHPRALVTTEEPTEKPRTSFAAEEVGQPWLIKKSTLYDHCGKTTSCFGFPNGCISKESCLLAMALWQEEGTTGAPDDYVNIALAATNPASRGYVSIGFSTDHYMGEDLVVSCLHVPTGPQVFMRQSYNSRYYQNVQIHQTSLSRIVVGYAQVNGVLTCFLKLDMIGSYKTKDGQNHDYDLLTKNHHIFMAFGKYNDIIGPKFGDLERHFAAVSTRDGVNLKDLSQNPKILGVYHSKLIDWHSITEILVHAFLLPASIIMAKYGQEAFSQPIKGLNNMSLCTVVHIVMTSLAVLLSLLGVVAIASEVGWSSYMPLAKAHSIFGILVYIMYFFSCIIGIYLSIKQSDIQHYYIGRVNIFRWCHWIIGNIIVLIGMFMLLFAPDMKRAFAPCIFRHLAGLLLLVHFLTVVVMSFHTYWLSTMLGSQIGFQLACYGPMVPFEPETDEMLKNFDKMEVWAGRRMAVVFYFIATALICGGMICLYCFPLTLCYTNIKY